MLLMVPAAYGDGVAVLVYIPQPQGHLTVVSIGRLAAFYVVLVPMEYSTNWMC